MRVIVTGGRAYQYPGLVCQVLAKVRKKHPGLVLVHGDCPTGVDRIAADWCDDCGVEQVRYPADWTRGPRGGPERNARMVNESGAQAVVAFPGGRGAKDCVARARAKGLTVMQVS